MEWNRVGERKFGDVFVGNPPARGSRSLSRRESETSKKRRNEGDGEREGTRVEDGKKWRRRSRIFNRCKVSSVERATTRFASHPLPRSSSFRFLNRKLFDKRPEAPLGKAGSVPTPSNNNSMLRFGNVIYFLISLYTSVDVLYRLLTKIIHIEGFMYEHYLFTLHQSKKFEVGILRSAWLNRSR